MGACLQCGTETENVAYCSRRCTGLARVTTGQLSVWNTKRSEQFHALALRDVLGNQWKSGDPVTLQQAVQLVRLGHRQGYHAAHFVQWRARR